MSNEALSVFCVVLALVVYALVLNNLVNWGRYDKLREEQAKTYGLELDVKYMKQDIKRLEERHWEARK